MTHNGSMEIVFAYLAGLLTLINPCVLPVLPIVLATALQASKWGPLALAAGMSVMFIVLGIGISAFGPALGINDQVVAQVAAGVMVLFGLALMSPGLGAVFTRLTNGLASRADAQLDEVDRGRLSGQFIGGLLLGMVWSPCIGPTLGGAIALASGGGSLLWAGAIMTGFALGVSTSSVYWPMGRVTCCNAGYSGCGLCPIAPVLFWGWFSFWWGGPFYLVCTTGLKFGPCKTYPIGCKICLFDFKTLLRRSCHEPS